ncbi:MAG: hypothetical protein KDC78_00915 [Aequorivita sp.]|nr:hypothetical protein [Aequorivita sp.]
MKNIAFLFILNFVLYSCSNDDNNNIPENVPVTFQFSQNWNGDAVDKTDFNSTTYTNDIGNVLTISKLRYLISKIQLKKSDGTLIEIDGYNLVDLSEEGSLEMTPSSIPTGDYIGISFIYGFNEEDNSNVYPDLNVALWNWPTMLGGGYHFMQMEGSFLDSNGAPQPYAYHNGTARVSQGVFEQNFISFDFNQNFTITNNATIEIKMNIAEWYKNPYQWDLNVFSTDLMMNYEAQKHMNDNGQSVFSIGSITQ